MTNTPDESDYLLDKGPCLDDLTAAEREAIQAEVDAIEADAGEQTGH